MVMYVVHGLSRGKKPDEITHAGCGQEMGENSRGKTKA
jgi:hypothetical protein